MPDNRRIRIIRHEESYEVRFSDGRNSEYFYYEEEPTRRNFTGRMTRKQAETAAKTFAGRERNTMKGRGRDELSCKPTTAS